MNTKGEGTSANQQHWRKPGHLFIFFDPGWNTAASNAEINSPQRPAGSIEMYFIFSFGVFF